MARLVETAVIFVEAAADCAAGDLVEVAGAEDADLGAVLYGETC